MIDLKRNIDIILILIVGFFLRLTISVQHSYTNDELSAINRLRFTSFSDLLEHGVKTGDMHPAGVQVFLKAWSSMVGTSEFALRLPFVLAGVFSIFLVFAIGKKWFNRSTGLYAATLLALLYFPIINAELVRPYSPGLMFTLLIVWFFDKVLFEKKPKWKHAIALGICFALAMYTHYFLFLFAAFIGVSGLLFLRKNNFKFYAVAGVIAVLLFLPHYGITHYHLSVGGLQWLGPPQNYWLITFLFYAFNHSWLLIVGILMLVAVAIIYGKRKKRFKVKYAYLSAFWFFGIYIIGHVISLLSTPVLKEPVMLFALPFLFFLFGIILSKLKRTTLVFTTLFVLCISSTLIEKKLFGDQHKGYKNTAKVMVDWRKTYGKDDIYTVYNLSNPNYMNFYATQFGDSVEFDWNVIEFGDDKLIRRDLLARSENYCIVGYSERLTLPQVFETVKEFYPIIVDCKHFDNSAIFLMAKEHAKPSTVDDEAHKSTFTALNLIDNKGWILDQSGVEVDSLNRTYYLLNEERIYGPDFVFKKSEANRFEKQYMKVIVNASCPLDGQLTVAISGMRNGKPIEHNGEIFWLGQDLEEMLVSTTDAKMRAGKAYFAFEIPNFIEESDELKISLWNRNGKEIHVFEIEIFVVENKWN